MLINRSLLMPPPSAFTVGFGPEKIVNGTFDADSDWTKAATGSPDAATIAGGVANLPRVDASNFSYIYQQITGDADEYSIAMDVSDGNVLVWVGGGPLSGSYGTQSFTPGLGRSFLVTTGGVDAYITIRAASNGTTSIVDNVSMKAVP